MSAWRRSPRACRRRSARAVRPPGRPAPPPAEVPPAGPPGPTRQCRSEEHTSELQSLMRISYAVFCLKKKNKKHSKTTHLQLDTQYTHIHPVTTKPKYSQEPIL